MFVTTGIPDGTLLLCEAGLEDVIVSRDQIFVEEERIVTASPDQKQAAFDKITAAWGPNAFEQYADFCARNGVDSDVMNARHAISWDMLEQLRDDPLVEIGAHTISHPRVSSLSQSEAFTELKKSRDRLIEKLNVPVRHFAFPFGRTKDCGPRDFALAKAASFASAATTRKGLIVHKQDFFQLPRNTINGRHRNLAMMEMHLSGLTGLATRVTRLG